MTDLWVDHLAANRRAADAYAVIRYAETTPGACLRCHKTRRAGLPYCTRDCYDKEYGRAYRW